MLLEARAQKSVSADLKQAELVTCSGSTAEGDIDDGNNEANGINGDLQLRARKIRPGKYLFLLFR